MGHPAFKTDLHFEVTQETYIAHLCSYINDDQAVASYVGCRRAKVAAVRATVPAYEPRRFLSERKERYQSGRESSGMNQDAEHRLDAENGSRRLRKMMDRGFDGFARRKGIKFADARLLLMNCAGGPV